MRKKILKKILKKMIFLMNLFLKGQRNPLVRLLANI